MISVEQAIQTAEERKAAIFGESEGPSLEFTAEGDFAQRALYGGFDLDPQEVTVVSHRAAAWFHNRASTFGLRALFAACWTDAFLIGLLAGQQSNLPPTNPDEGMDTLVGGEDLP